MKTLRHIMAKLSLLLILSILVLSTGYLLISCGTGPMLKVLEILKGAFAIDFSLASGTDNAYISADGSGYPTINGVEFTIEAWVKRRNATAANMDGAIFSYAKDNGGVILYVIDNNVRARLIHNVSSCSIVSSTFTLPYNNNDTDWTHIAAVLHNTAHGSCTGTPHVDFYLYDDINGTRTSCDNTPTGQNVTDPSDKTVFMGWMPTLTQGIFTESRPDIIIDDVRFWLTARSSQDINLCKDGLLGVNSPCNIDSSLKGYWPLNEGTGTAATDISGNGAVGTIYSPADVLWSGGWVAGKF